MRSLYTDRKLNRYHPIRGSNNTFAHLAKVEFVDEFVVTITKTVRMIIPQVKDKDQFFAHYTLVPSVNTRMEAQVRAPTK